MTVTVYTPCCQFRRCFQRDISLPFIHLKTIVLQDAGCYLVHNKTIINQLVVVILIFEFIQQSICCVHHGTSPLFEFECAMGAQFLNKRMMITRVYLR